MKGNTGTTTTYVVQRLTSNDRWQDVLQDSDRETGAKMLGAYEAHGMRGPYRLVERVMTTKQEVLEGLK